MPLRTIQRLPLFRLPLNPAIGRAAQHRNGGHAGAGEQGVAGEHILTALLREHAIGHQLRAKALLRGALDGSHVADAGRRALVHDKALRGVLAHATDIRAFAIEQLRWLRFAVARARVVGQWLKNGLAQRGQKIQAV